MPDTDTAAMQWAQSNPQDPRAQHVMAKVWASQNPNDPRSAAILQKVGTVAPQQSAQQQFSAKNPITAGSMANMLPPVMAKGYADDLQNSPRSGLANVGGLLRTQLEHGANAATLGYLPQIEGRVRSVVSGQPYVGQRDAVISRMQQDAQDYPNTAALGKSAGAAVAGAGLAAPLSAIAGPASAGAASRIAGASMAGGAVGLAVNPGDTPGVVDPIQAPQRRLNGAVGDIMGGALQAGSDAASGAGNWFRGAANSMMKRSVGLTGAKAKSYPSDIGNRMVDEGIWGTKSQMAEQVTQKYAQSEARVQDLARQSQGAGSNQMAEQIIAKSDQYLNPDTGAPMPGREGLVQAHHDVADAVAQGGRGYQAATPPTTRNMIDSSGDAVPISTTPGTPGSNGTYSGPALLGLKRAGDAQAFNQSGMMGNSDMAEGFRAQGDVARQNLSDTTGGQMPQALQQEQTLLAANHGLMQPQMTYRNPVTLTDIGGSMVMGPSGGLPGAGTAVLASKAAVSPLAQSFGAKAFQQGVAPALNTAGSMGQAASPLLYPAMFGDQNGAQR